MPTVTAPANKGYVWDLLGSAYGYAHGSSVPHGNTSSPYWQPHYDFNWPTLPAGAIIQSAEFYVKWSGGVPSYADSGNPVADVTVYEITGSWTEGDTKPSLGSSAGNLPTTALGWAYANVTGFVTQRYSGTAKYGLAWGSMDYRDSSVYHYGDDQADRPYIEITYITNRAPNAPSLSAPSVFDAGAGLTVTLTHNDPDNDTLTGVYLNRVHGSTTEWWSGSAWVTSEPVSPIAASGTSKALTIASGWEPGVTYQFYGATVDVQGLKGPYSSVAVQAKASSLPVCSVSVPAPGGFVSSTKVRVIASMTCVAGAVPASYSAKLYAANGTTVLSGPHTVVSAGLLDYEIDYGLTTATGYQVGVAPTDSDGLQGAEVKVPFTTSFIPPETGPFAATPFSSLGFTRVTFTGQGVDVSVNHVYRRERDGDWVRLSTTVPPNGTYDDYTAASGVVYEYQGDAVGVNGVVTATNVAATSLTLTGLWLHNIDDPQGTAIELGTQARDEDWTADVTFMKVAGRTRPIADVGESDDGAFRAEVLVEDKATKEALRRLIMTKPLLCVRDNSGRKLFGMVPTMAQADELWGGFAFSLEVTETDFDEAVSA